MHLGTLSNNLAFLSRNHDMPQAGSDYLPVEARIENDTSLTVCSILWLESSQARIEMPHLYIYGYSNLRSLLIGDV